jgi:hypothetical protein
MSENKTKIMSLSLDEDMYNLIKDSSKKLGHKNVSQMIRELISKYLDLLINDQDEIPVIIKIPSELVEDKDELRSWLDSRINAIIKSL